MATEKPAEAPAVATFETGAQRSAEVDEFRFDLISPIVLRELAATYAEGARKYQPNNWLRGFPASNLLNHALSHIAKWQEGDDSEPHLAHAIWNLATIIHFSKTRPELIDRPFAADPYSWVAEPQRTAMREKASQLHGGG